MIKKLENPIVYSEEQVIYLNTLKPFQTGTWEDIQTNNMKAIKLVIKSHLDFIQEKKCAYCGLNLYETSDPEIEHIAPKGKIGTQLLYPQFTFTEENLVLACHRCNCTRKKTYDSISVCTTQYNNCTFRIVHPYFDTPEEHLKWAGNDTQIVIIGLTDKGKETISLFGLASEEHSSARAKQVVFEHLSSEDRALIKRILEFKITNP